ncbi:hypothetical protein DFP73DRAFT_556068 [Morchella snyderi]|nr:hypothetical protein DFP73DRAFT_556068 [Morchella snyderi]
MTSPYQPQGQSPQSKPYSASSNYPYTASPPGTSTQSPTSQQNNYFLHHHHTTTTTPPPPLPPTAPAPAQQPAAAAAAARQNQIPPGGAPARRYLNENVTPVLLEGMKMLAREQPKEPLLALARWLEEQHRELAAAAAGAGGQGGVKVEGGA